MAGESAGVAVFVKESRFLAGTLEHWRVGLRGGLGSVSVRRVRELGRGQKLGRDEVGELTRSKRDNGIRLNGNRDERLENWVVEDNLVVVVMSEGGRKKDAWDLSWARCLSGLGFSAP